MNLAIIPVKCNSKRLPEKNLKYIKGKPLFLYAVDSVLSVNYLFEKIVVCSEDTAVEKILRNYCVFEEYPEVEFIKRPMTLSQDPAEIADVCIWILKLMASRGEVFSRFLMRQPSNPFVTGEDIEKTFHLHELGYNCDVRSGSIIKKSVWFEDSYYSPRLKRYDKTAFVGNGGLVWAGVKQFIDKGDFSEACYPYVMEPERSIDIDTQLDFDIAKMLLIRS